MVRRPPGTGAARAGIVALGLLVVVPALGLLVHAVDPPADPFGGAPPSLATLLMAPGTAGLVLRTLALAAGVSAGSVVLGTLLAWSEHRLDLPGARWLGMLTLLPLALPSYIVAGTVRSAMGRGGWLGSALGLDGFTGLPAAVLVLTVATTPYVQLVVGAALTRIGASTEEAARTLGASPWRAFRHGTLPALRPALAYGALISLLYAASDFGAVAVLDAPVLTWRLFEAVTHQDLARATLYALLLLAVVAPLYTGGRWLRGRDEGRGASNPRPPDRRRPGLLLAVAVGLAMGVVLGVGLVLPVGAQLAWVWDGIQRNLTFAPILEPVLHSVGVASVAAVLTVLLALAPAWGAGHERSVWRTAGEQLAYLPSAVPGVLVAFGLLLAGLGLTRGLGHPEHYAPLLASGVLLMAGLALRFVAEAFGPVRAAALRVDPRLWDAARMLGAPRGRYLRSVVLPGLSPGVASAAVVVFVAVVKELPVTLVLGSATGLRPLPYRVWDRYSEALWHDAGLAGLLLVAVALVGMVLVSRRRHT